MSSSDHQERIPLGVFFDIGGIASLKGLTDFLSCMDYSGHYTDKEGETLEINGWGFEFNATEFQDCYCHKVIKEDKTVFYIEDDEYGEYLQSCLFSDNEDDLREICKELEIAYKPEKNRKINQYL